MNQILRADENRQIWKKLTESRHNTICRSGLINCNYRAPRSSRTRRIQDFNLTCIPKENGHAFGTACRDSGSVQIKSQISNAACRKNLRYNLANAAKTRDQDMIVQVLFYLLDTRDGHFFTPCPE